MNTITVDEAAAKLGYSPGELFGYTHLRHYGDAGTPQRFWLYQALTDEEAENITHHGDLRKIIPNA